MIRRRPFFWIFLFFAAGLFCQQHTRFSPFFLIPVTAGFLGAAFRFRNRAKPGLLFLSLALVALGWWHGYSAWKFPAGHLYYHRHLFLGRAVNVRGVIVSEVKDKTAPWGSKKIFTLAVREIDNGPVRRPARGKVKVQLFQNQPLAYGDAIIARGKLHRPWEFSHARKFSYRRYLARRGIYWIFSVKGKNPIYATAKNQANGVIAFALSLRRRMESVFGHYLSAAESGLMRAMVLGERSGLPAGIHLLFKRTGTAHVLAISGLHVGIVAVLFFLLLKLFPLPRRGRYILTMVLLIGYALLTGGRPSVIRAVVMASIFLAGFVLERETDSLNSLSLAGFLLLVFDPMNLADIGFQLSFVSVLSIILFYPFIWGGLLTFGFDPANQFVGFLGPSLAGSLSAWLGVAGLVAYHFDIVTPVTILANIAVIPMIALIVALGFGLLATGYLPFLPLCFAACLKVALNLLLAVTYIVDKIPGAYFRFSHFPLWAAVIYYLIFTVAAWVCLCRPPSGEWTPP